ncbi:MAG: hypothetical protein AAF517_04575 [Planctomycetota bacterium]
MVGTSLASLANEHQEVDLEAGALDVAAEAGLVRLREIHLCWEGLPELCESFEDELANLRHEFVREHKQVRKKIGGLLQAQPALQVRFEGKTGMIRVCAWCQRASVSGRWVPIGHLLTSSRVGRLTHGICPRCAGKFEEGL